MDGRIKAALVFTGAAVFGVAVGADFRSTGARAAASPPPTEVTTVYVTRPAPPPVTVTVTVTPPSTSKPPTGAASPLPGGFTVGGDGMYAVDEYVLPGVYRTVGPSRGGSCYWERDRDWSGAPGSVIASGSAHGAATVEILSTDVVFVSRGCADWSKIG